MTKHKQIFAGTFILAIVTVVPKTWQRKYPENKILGNNSYLSKTTTSFDIFKMNDKI